MQVLFVGDLTPGHQFRQRRDALVQLGHDVESVDTRCPPGRCRTRRFCSRVSFKLFRMGFNRFSLIELGEENRQVLDHFSRRSWDVLWLDRAVTIEPRTLQQVKEIQPHCVIAGYANDDMAGRHNQSRQFLQHLPFYDVYFTTKSYNVAELEAIGCRQCEFIAKAFDPRIHRPLAVTAQERSRLGGPVGFVGSWEPERAASLGRLAQAGIPVRVWGSNWHRLRPRDARLSIGYRDVVGNEYAKALSSFDIALGFLRKMNRDLQTARSIEIPACGAFMLAERTNEHLELFDEGKEAEFFDSDDELVDKAKYYLAHPAQRRRIAAAGRRRCLESGYRHHDRLTAMLRVIESISDSRLGRQAALLAK